MFEVFNIYTGEVFAVRDTEMEAWDCVHARKDSQDYDIRMAEDLWPEYESVMEREKYQ